MRLTKKPLLLISNSTLHGSGYLDHAEAAIRGFPGTTMLRVEGNAAVLQGSAAARIFSRADEPIEVPPGTALEELLAS